MPNRAINSGRIVARFVEWHLAGGAQPLAASMNGGVWLAVQVRQQRVPPRLETGAARRWRLEKPMPWTSLALCLPIFARSSVAARDHSAGLRSQATPKIFIVLMRLYLSSSLRMRPCIAG